MGAFVGFDVGAGTVGIIVVGLAVVGFRVGFDVGTGIVGIIVVGLAVVGLRVGFDVGTGIVGIIVVGRAVVGFIVGSDVGDCAAATEGIPSDKMMGAAQTAFRMSRLEGSSGASPSPALGALRSCSSTSRRRRTVRNSSRSSCRV